METYPGFSNLLADLLSGRKDIRTNAENQVRELKRQNQNKFLTTLVVELIGDHNPPPSKQMASVVFKNTLLNPTRDEQNKNVWERQDPQMRQNIKEALMAQLGHEDVSVIKAAATCVAAIAVIEVPKNEWPQLIQTLTDNSGSNVLNIRLASIQTLGLICEDIDPECIPMDQMNNILFALLSNINPGDIDLTLIAMKAFSRAAPITNRNFQVEQQKQYIMNQVFLASDIDNEDILVAIMEAINDIVKVNYDYMFDYIERIGSLTMKLIASEHEKAAKLAIEIWTTFAEVELARKAQGKPCQNFVPACLGSIMDIILMGLQKFDQSMNDEQLDEMSETNLTLSSGYTLEYISRVCGNDVMQPVFNFITPKFASPNWGDRYIGMIAFGSIIDGPNSSDLAATLSPAFNDIVNMLNDAVPKVRQTVSFVFYKLSEFVPEVIFMSTDNLDLFVNSCLQHIPEHHLISTLLVGALKNLFTQAFRAGCSSLLNPYFQAIFSKLLETMYREDIHHANELQVISDAINDISDSCDAVSLRPMLKEFLLGVLQELANTMDPNVFQLKLTPDQRENFQNFLGSLLQILITKLKEDIDQELAGNIIQLVKSLFDYNQKVIQGGQLVFHAMVVVCEKNIESFIQLLGPYIVAAIDNFNDENCARFACGLVSDLSNYLEKGMQFFAHDFMQSLNKVLKGEDYTTDTKVHAMIAVGDICLAIEEQFQQYIEETMQCLFAACQLTVQPPQNFESEESIVKLRDAIIDAFISIVHGMQGVAQPGSQQDRVLQGYATDILHYIDALLSLPALSTNAEFIRNIYELYIDISEYYGENIQGAIRQMNGPRILRDGLPNFAQSVEGMSEIGGRFLATMNRVGCI